MTNSQVVESVWQGEVTRREFFDSVNEAEAWITEAKPKFSDELSYRIVTAKDVEFLPGFSIDSWWASEGLTIQFAYRRTEKGCVILAQGNENGDDPFSAPSIEHQYWPVQVCFVPARYMQQYDDEVGLMYTTSGAESHSADLKAANVYEALLAAKLLLD